MNRRVTRRHGETASCAHLCAAMRQRGRDSRPDDDHVLRQSDVGDFGAGLEACDNAGCLLKEASEKVMGGKQADGGKLGAGFRK